MLIGGKGQATEEELATALTRARTCELVAATVAPSLAAEAFTAGLLASFDVLLGLPLEDILRDLPLEEDLRHAILYGEGAPGRLVADVTDFQLVGQRRPFGVASKTRTFLLPRCED